jgi:hypothetical protein
MGRLIHPSGDLEIGIQGIDVEGDALRIRAQMGVWNAQILLAPEEVASLVRSLFSPRLVRYVILLPWKLRRRGDRKTV